MRWIGLVLVLLIAGCGKRNHEDVRAFFERGKVSGSIDWGVVKWDDPNNFVIAVFGFTNDHKTCRDVAAALNKQDCEELMKGVCVDPYSCVPLNR
jgi:hypothetical protein